MAEFLSFSAIRLGRRHLSEGGRRWEALHQVRDRDGPRGDGNTQTKTRVGCGGLVVVVEYNISECDKKKRKKEKKTAVLFTKVFFPPPFVLALPG